MRSTQLSQQAIEIEQAMQEYKSYQAQQRNFTFPDAAISIEPSNDRVEVYMDVKFNNINFHFESVKLEHAEQIYNILNSQAAVRAKLGDGKTRTREQTNDYIKSLNNRFALDANGEPAEPHAHLYSGFIVSDAEENVFLGWVNLAPSNEGKNYAETSRLNRSDAWSATPQDIMQEYNIENKLLPSKTYAGVGTAEACVLVQYAHHLKHNGYKVNGQELAEVVATARVDNPGSWKSNAKAGFEVYAVDTNAQYGPELRYQLKKAVL